jgi:hypothetical protein
MRQHKPATRLVYSKIVLLTAMTHLILNAGYKSRIRNFKATDL